MYDLQAEKSVKERMARDLKAMTTINHAIHIANVDAVRVDQWVYVECNTPWASNGRIMVHSRMFSRDGTLLATCAQEVSRALHSYVEFALLMILKGLLLLRKPLGDDIARQKL